jgi:hypothetical protein
MKIIMVVICCILSGCSWLGDTPQGQRTKSVDACINQGGIPILVVHEERGYGLINEMKECKFKDAK